jgi:tRNA(Ile)-lysidine synthase
MNPGCYNEAMKFPDLEQVLSEYCGLRPSDGILVGVSGGPDSLTLLDILVRQGYSVAAAHFNHHLRTEADVDAGAVQTAAARYGIDFYAGEGDVNWLAKTEKLTIEEAARIARYRFLFLTANQIGARALAVGHTADDQVETILMHLLRGSGMAGLRGMPWRGELPEFDPFMPLVRPLLGMWREDIIAYCEEHGLQPVTDATNFDPAYYRNKLRLELIPYLSQYNPRVKELLWRTGQTLQGDYEIVGHAAREAEETILLESGAGFENLDLAKFLHQPAGIRRILMRRLIGRLRENERDIDFETVERALEFIKQPGRSAEIELALGLNLLVEDGKIILKEKNLELASGDWPHLEQDQLPLEIPGRIDLANGWELAAELLERKTVAAADLTAGDSMTCWLDREKLSEPTVVRRHQPGDLMRPYGFDGHNIKVSDIWVNIKLPRRARKNWPLVCSGMRIAWLPGYRPGNDFVVDGSTRQVVKLSLVRADPARR